MSLALYRKYRSRSLDEIVGQSHVTELLAQAIKHDRVAHAYLFTGPRGTGKTSIARILAHEINHLPYNSEATELDIIEIDAASNNGVDDIRDLRDKVQIAPVSAKKKVYIIDEVHMLSKPAFNALLKTLEEPPEHVVFILATTDIDKVPATILSRTQRHTFKRASTDDIILNLKRIAKAEHITIEPNALKIIALHSDGSFRDSVSLFDQLTSTRDEGEKITAEFVQRLLGLADDEAIKELLDATLVGDIATINNRLNMFDSSGTPARSISQQLMYHIRTHLPDGTASLPLLDQLLDVGKSSYPELKLLTTLSLFRTDNPDTRPVAIEPPIKSVVQSSPNISEATASKSLDVPDTKKTPKPKQSTKKPQQAAAIFDWRLLVEYVRSHYVALHSVLSKCEPIIDGTTLTLYTKNPFYKKKLDDAKYRTLLHDSLDALGFEITIETIPTSAPLKNSNAARVAAMMGGGEEVSVDDA